MTPQELARYRMLKKLAMAPKPDTSTLGGPSFGTYGRGKNSGGG